MGRRLVRMSVKRLPMQTMTIDPADIQPTQTRLLVSRYELPEVISEVEGPDGETVEIVTAEAWRRDRSQSIWNVVAVGPDVNRVLREEGVVIQIHEDYDGDVRDSGLVEPGDIIETGAWTHVPLGDERHYFVLAESIRVIHKWETNDD